MCVRDGDLRNILKLNHTSSSFWRLFNTTAFKVLPPRGLGSAACVLREYESYFYWKFRSYNTFWRWLLLPRLLPVLPPHQPKCTLSCSLSVIRKTEEWETSEHNSPKRHISIKSLPSGLRKHYRSPQWMERGRVSRGYPRKQDLPDYQNWHTYQLRLCGIVHRLCTGLSQMVSPAQRMEVDTCSSP